MFGAASATAQLADDTLDELSSAGIPLPARRRRRIFRCPADTASTAGYNLSGPAGGFVRLMTTSFNSDEGHPPTSSVGARRQSQPQLGTRLTPFVGRENELATLSERLEAAERGDGGVVFIRGEPGIGKSRLLDEFATIAEADAWLILRGRAYDMEGMPPYLPFMEVLREQLRHASDESLAELASGAPELCVLLPEISARVPELPQVSGLGPEAERFRLFEAVAEFLIGISRQSGIKGLLVVMDDLHWADRTSVLLLQHVARKLGGVRLLVAAAYRTTRIEREHPLSGVAAELTHEHNGRQMAVLPLTADETATLIESLAGATADRALSLNIHNETSGNPFFVEGLVRHLLERDSTLSVTSPRSTASRRRSSGDQPESVPPYESTNAALQTAAILGESFGFECCQRPATWLRLRSSMPWRRLSGQVSSANKATVCVCPWAHPPHHR